MSVVVESETSRSNKEKSTLALSTAARIKKLAIDRFVLTHFFLLFFVSFVIGVLFLHSTITLWESQTTEEALMNTLESATHKFNLNNQTRKILNFNTMSITSQMNKTFNMDVR